MTHLNKIIPLLQQAEDFLVISHERPDGDAVASLAAFYDVFNRQLHKQVYLFCPEPVPPVFDFLGISQLVSNSFQPVANRLSGLVITLDCGDSRRTGLIKQLQELQKAGWQLINIDHHPKNDLWRLANFNLIDETACSTAEILYRLLNKLNIIINKDIATALLTGFYTDTGGFQHANTSSQTFRLVAELMLAGGRLKTIVNHVTNGRSVPVMRLWGLVLERLVWRPDLDLVWAAITRDDLGRIGVNDHHLSGVVNLMNNIAEARAALLFYELADGRIKVSMRTEEADIDLTELAWWFGGGGLPRASGFTTPGRLVYNKGRWDIRS